MRFGFWNGLQTRKCNLGHLGQLRILGHLVVLGRKTEAKGVISNPGELLQGVGQWRSGVWVLYENMVRVFFWFFFF